MRAPKRFIHVLPVALCLFLFACGNAGRPSAPTNSVQSPVPPSAIASGLRLGSAFAIYLDANGNVFGRGRNISGVLGTVTASDCTVFVLITSSDNADLDFRRISAGGGHVLAVNTSGQVYAWGGNDSGELGRSGPSSPLPIAVSGIPRPVADVYAGWGTSFAVLDNGALWAWGENGNGELGLGHIASPQAAPVPVPGVSGVRQVSPGGSFTLVVLDNGALYGMGYNGVGQLGLGDRVIRTSPTRIDTGGAVVRSATAGADMSAYITSDDRLYVMGDNGNGIVGDGSNSGFLLLPTASLIDIADVACGYAHILAMTTGGDVLSWGRNTMGALGRGSAAGSLPTAGFLSGGPPATGTAAVYASPFNDYSYALGDDGRFWAWGANAYGQLGLSPTQFPRTNAPVDVGMAPP